MTNDLEARRLTQLLGEALRNDAVDPQWLVSGDLGALVQPSPSDQHQGSDVAVTLHGASAQIADFSVVILDRFGNLSRSRFSRRGHSVVRGLGAAPWAVRVEAFDERAPQSVMNRWAALAAATNFENRQYVATSSDAEVVCVVTEDDDGHLIAEFGGDLAPDALIRMRWVRVDEFLEEAHRYVLTDSGGVLTQRDLKCVVTTEKEAEASVIRHAGFRSEPIARGNFLRAAMPGGSNRTANSSTSSWQLCGRLSLCDQKRVPAHEQP